MAKAVPDGVHPKAASIAIQDAAVEEMNWLSAAPYSRFNGYTKLAIEEAYKFRRYFPDTKFHFVRGSYGLGLGPILEGNPHFFSKDKKELLDSLDTQTTTRSQMICECCGEDLLPGEATPYAASRCAICTAWDARIIGSDGKVILDHPKAASIERQRLITKGVWDKHGAVIPNNGWSGLVLEIMPRLHAIAPRHSPDAKPTAKGLALIVGTSGHSSYTPQQIRALRDLSADVQKRSLGICMTCGDLLTPDELTPGRAASCGACKSADSFRAAVSGNPASPVAPGSSTPSEPAKVGEVAIGCLGILVVAGFAGWAIFGWLIPLILSNFN
jgi:hypothetical protein